MLNIDRIRHMGRAFIRRAKITAAYRDVFDGEGGRAVLHDILRRGGLLDTGMVAGAPDMTAFNCGRRALALEIIEVLRWDAEHVIALAEERDALEAREAA